MTNAELIAALRYCISDNADDCDLCPYQSDCKRNGTGKDKMIRDAADALEAADKRIEELSLDCEVLQYSCNELTTKCNQLQEEVDNYEKRIAELEAQLPKEGEWKKILQNGDGTSDYQCSACLGIIMDVPDDDEHPLCSFCPNCGARMRGEHDEQ